MPLLTEPIGSIPRSAQLIEGIRRFGGGRMAVDELEGLFDNAVRGHVLAAASLVEMYARS